MADYGHTMPPMAAPRHPHSQAAAYGAPMSMQPPTAPAGTFAPGTKIQCGSHRVVIQKYLSEGGFAHVYLVKLAKPIDGTDLAVLKRVAVPDRDTLRGMRTEVETMKRLKGHRPIVTYIDSHASELRGGGYEVFLLMEYCDGGGLIDFMNTRLQHRLTEPEIVKILTDVAEGVACMHYLKPPLLHRDLKVENVLITMVGTTRKFKLCDFGSAAAPKPAPQSIVECRLLDEDVQKHTTMQYRSPEMVDVYRKQPIGEKSDIWALGVLLYKLCYYTTPFEEQGQLAILNASFKFPSYPVFSGRLKQLIASMLREDQNARPNIYQVLREACSMQGHSVPIHDIYSGRSQDLERLPASSARDPGALVVGAVFSPTPQVQQQAIPEVAPMRRGRPPASSSQAQQVPKTSRSPMRVANGDPFAALDSQGASSFQPDEVANRFPSLDQFALLHDRGAKFEFDSPTLPAEPTQEAASRMPEALQTQPLDPSRVQTHPVSVQKPGSATPTPSAGLSRASAIISKNPELQAIASPALQPIATTSSRSPMPPMGTVTAGSPPLAESYKPQYPPIYRFPPPDQGRSTSLPRQQGTANAVSTVQADSTRPRPGANPRVQSYQPASAHARHPSSSRPSLEGGRPSFDIGDIGESLSLTKTVSNSGRPRPASTYLESNLDYLREREAAPRPLRSPGLAYGKLPDREASTGPPEETSIESNVEFLRSMEEADGKKKDKASKHSKRSSLASLSGTKNILAGKFGDAFKRFEGNHSSAHNLDLPRSPPPPEVTRVLTPIAGSEATDGRSDDGRGLGDGEELTPEMRRDLEAEVLAKEERRVEAAAAEYRERLAARDAGGDSQQSLLPKSIAGVSRAVSIQNRVQNLLGESQRVTSTKTAEGYGRYTDGPSSSDPGDKLLADLPRKTGVAGTGRGAPSKPLSNSVDATARARSAGGTPAQSSDTGSRPALSLKPSAPPKPTYLNRPATGGGRRSPMKQLLRPARGELHPDQLAGIELDMSPQQREDDVRDFSKRFPSLGSIEMVERDIGPGPEPADRRVGAGH